MRYTDGRPPGLVITPDTHPDRFTATDRALFKQGVCGHVIEDGNGRGAIHCREKSAPGADFGDCRPHAERLRNEGETNWRLSWNGRLR
ncbi:hypothetical protein ACLQ2R_17145 [Streptosporangium sp. DT93]|uniref:hypothetical protein n=1 Tax=Streptosporangium sp. DT93 TaxID=3393428 RepID=UPI003CED6749